MLCGYKGDETEYMRVLAGVKMLLWYSGGGCGVYCDALDLLT